MGDFVVVAGESLELLYRLAAGHNQRSIATEAFPYGPKLAVGLIIERLSAHWSLVLGFSLAKTLRLEETVVQLTKNGPVLHGRLDSLRDRFATEHCVVLRNMLEAPLLEKIQRNIERAQWRCCALTDDSGAEWAAELTLDSPVTTSVIDFLLNHSEFLKVVRIITGCNQISDFGSGRIYRMAAGHQHHISWHDDLANAENRQVGFSMNLSTGVFRGGAFELRNRLTMKLVAQVNNTGFGDALLFRVSHDLEHRVTPLMEGVPKTACAGWFRATGRNYIVKDLIDRHHREDERTVR